MAISPGYCAAFNENLMEKLQQELNKQPEDKNYYDDSDDSDL